MICETVYLREDDPNIRLCTYISAYAGDMCCGPRDAVLICPGGGYSFLAEREAEPAAKAFLAAGFNVFILYYSIGDSALYPRPLVDASLAMCHIKDHAEDYHIDPERIFVCGFSAGGHLAGALGTLWDRPYAATSPDMPYGKNKPRGMILSYPVITLGEYTHEGSRYMILRDQWESPEAQDAYSLEKQVCETTVPAFVWQTQEDDCVPIQNSMLFAQAMIEHQIPVELHVYPKGPHGLSISTMETAWYNPELADPHIGSWVKAAIEWTKLI